MTIIRAAVKKLPVACDDRQFVMGVEFVRPGRPATGQDPVTAIRLSAKMRENVDTWAAKQDDGPGRSEAIRRLVELGLRVKK